MTLYDNPQFSWKLNDVKGYIPDVWFYNAPDDSSTTHYNNDKLVAVLLGTVAKLYSDFLKYYGAIGPRNLCTYFKTQEECEIFLDILRYLFDEIYNKHRDWLSVTWEIINGTSDIATNNVEDRENYYLGHIKTYRNLQSYQGTYMDINTTKLDPKDLNLGKFTYDPFKPNQSKKPSHYEFL